MSIGLEDPLSALGGLEIQAAQAQIVTWQGRPALRLENGLALLSGPRPADARIEVLVGVDGPAYPGVAFRVADPGNYELAYPVPHVSGQWDALQYDPVFHGSNTWQLFSGPSYQRAAEVPIGRWFRLQVTYHGTRAAIAVGNQPPLVVEQLAHPCGPGALGLWTYLPAHFAELRVSSCTELAASGEVPAAARGAVTCWNVEGRGTILCEPNGVLNLNRLFPPTQGVAHMRRRFTLAAAGTVSFSIGFSDRLVLAVDGREIYRGEHTFHGFADRDARGYAEVGAHCVQVPLEAGPHQVSAVLEVAEGFGWGLALSAHAAGLEWLPAEPGAPPTDAPEAVRTGYDAMAAAYLATRSADSPDMQLLPDLIRRLPPGAAVLDAGCGAGVPVTRCLSQSFQVTGVDFSAAQVRLARELVPNARFICQDLTTLDLPDGTFDAICSYYAIIHIPREMHAALFRSFYRMLKPAGLALLCLGADDLPDSWEDDYLGVPMYWSHYDAPTNLRLLQECGFEVAESRIVPDSTSPGSAHLFVLARKPEAQEGSR